MRRIHLFALALLLLGATLTPAHIVPPPPIPEIDETAPATVSASATSIDVVVDTCCAYPVARRFTVKKNGSPVTPNYTLTVTHPNPCDDHAVYTVNLTSLNLQVGDVLDWKCEAAATSGPNKGVKVSDTAQTSVVQ